MSIKLEEVTCSRCIYSAKDGTECRIKEPTTIATEAAMGDDAILRHKINSVTKSTEPDYWCGEGEWVVYSQDKNGDIFKELKSWEEMVMWCHLWEWER